jgi:aspartate aminotransferase
LTQNPRLDALRAEIVDVTLDIISLIGKRRNLVEEVAVEKLRVEIPIVNSTVELNLRKAVTERCKEEQLDESYALSILNQLLIDSVKRQETIHETSGTPNAYTCFIAAKEMEQQGIEVFHLEVGEPDFGPPESVKRSLETALNSGYAKYTETAGISILRNAISQKLSNQYKYDIKPDQVIVTPGGRFGLYLAISNEIAPGDEVIIIDPSYPAYSELVKTAGGRPIDLPTHLEDAWNPDSDQLEHLINDATRMIILNSPSNPTGKIIDHSTLQAVTELAKDNNIRILSDEVYSNFAFDKHHSILQFPEINQVFIDSFSKTFGMTGFRLGYAVSDVETIKQITKLQNAILTSVPEFIQHAGTQAISCTVEEREYSAIMNQRQQLMCSLLRKMPVSFYRPDGGFYIFVRINSDNLDGFEFAERLLTEKQVSVVPGITYGSEYSRFFRISLCQPKENLRLAASRIEEVLS